jgi:membrane fusion protein (multidrug efflux system)
MNYIQKFAALFSLVGIIGCQSNDKNAAPQTAAPPPILEYSVLVLTPRSTTLFSDYPATIQGQQNIEIRPKIDGYIDAIYVDEGAIVSKGQTLFRISAPQYEQEVRTAQANIKIAEADVQAAQMEVSKVSPLVEKNIISKYELESRQYILQAKQATLAQAQARLVNAKTNLGYTTIASPVNGVIGAIPFKMGSLVSSNMAQALTTVSDIKNIHAYFSINEKQALQFMRNTPGDYTKRAIIQYAASYFIACRWR